MRARAPQISAPPRAPLPAPSPRVASASGCARRRAPTRPPHPPAGAPRPRRSRPTRPGRPARGRRLDPRGGASRGTVAPKVFPSDWRSVSATGTASAAAPCSTTARTTAETSAGRTKGRTASCTMTTGTEAGTAATPRATDAWRVSPPATTARTKAAAGLEANRWWTRATSCAATTTTAPRTSGAAASASRLRTRTGWPPNVRNCFAGASGPPPMRVPLPAAGTTAHASSLAMCCSCGAPRT